MATPVPEARNRRLSRDLASGLLVPVLLLVAGGSSGVASAGAPPGAHWSPTFDILAEGCARGTMANPSWSWATDTAKWQGAVQGKSCRGVSGGPLTESLAAAEGTIGFGLPIKLPTGPGGVNLSWSLRFTARDDVVLPAHPQCPVVRTNTSQYTKSTNDWYNTSTVDRTCLATATVVLELSAYVLDRTNGSVAWGTTVPTYSNVSGRELVNQSYSTTHSNPKYWYLNSTTTDYQVANFGPNGSISGSFTPTLSITGAFKAAHQYQLVAEIVYGTYLEIVGYRHASGSAVFDGKGPRGYESLSSVTTW